MSSQTQVAGRKRLVHHLDTPFTTVSWPEIPQDDQDTILELLCSFLSPLGQHRKLQGAPSKGKRAARQAKKTAAAAAAAASSDSSTASTAAGAPGSDPSRPIKTAPAKPEKPDRPELSSSVDVGFNSITRGLQASSSPPASAKTASTEAESPYSVVFVARGNQSSAFNCHFPQMIGAASQKGPARQRMRLVGFSKPCSDRLSTALGIPRVSSVAVRRMAPGAQALLAFVEEKVAPVDVPWMATEGGDIDVDYRATQITSTETTVGAKRVRQS